MRPTERDDKDAQPMQPGPGVVTKGKDLVSRGWQATAEVTTEFGGTTRFAAQALEVGAAEAARAALQAAIDKAEVGADNDMVAATVTLARPRKGDAR